jgi:hypothetical protein
MDRGQHAAELDRHMNVWSVRMAEQLEERQELLQDEFKETETVMCTQLFDIQEQV